MKDKLLIAIPSYKRANKQKTFELLKTLRLTAKYDVNVFIYENDPERKEYFSSIGMYLHIISKEKIKSPNLRAKRNYIFDYAKENNYRYVLQLDDDIEFIGRRYDIKCFIEDAIDLFERCNKLAMISPAMTALRMINHKTIDFDVICHCTAIYDLQKIKDLRFPLDVKCEDNWMSLELLRTGYRTCNLNEYVIYNNDAKRDGMTNDGLSYMYEETGLDITNDLLKRFPDLVNAKVIYKEDGKIKINKYELEQWRTNK